MTKISPARSRSSAVELPRVSTVIPTKDSPTNPGEIAMAVVPGSIGPESRMVVGLIKDIPTVKELIDRIMADAERIILDRLAGFLGAESKAALKVA